MNQNLSNSKTSILLILCLFIISGCGMRFYKSNQIPAENKLEKINLAIIANKYFIVHQGEKKWHLTKPIIIAESGENNIKGSLGEVGSRQTEMEEKLEINKKDGGKFAYSPRFGEGHSASLQIHLFLNDSVTINNELNIPLIHITKIEDYVIAPGATLISHLAMNTIIPGVILAIVCNCPYVYSYDNTKLNFEGNLYSGAIYPNLERNDYLTIPNMALTDEKYKFRLENPRDDEQQFTNFMQMIVVHHPTDLKVLPDRKGNLHTIKNVQKPQEAVSSDSINQLPQVSEKDGQFYQFNENQDVDDLNGIVLKFKNEGKVNNPKLVLSLKNSDWAGYIYKEVMSLFGNKLTVWQKKKMKHSSDEINARSVAQGTLLSVYLKTKTGWKFIDYVNTPGSVTTRDIILPIEIIEKENDVEIMLKGGFRFWDLDYAAMDFSPDETLEIEYLQPKSVLDSLGNDHSVSLLADDSNYLNQLTVSDKFEITFDNIPKKGNLTQTMILNGKGYYKRLEKRTGEAIRFLL